MLGLLIAITTGILVEQSRQQAIHEAEHELRSLALTLADQAERSFEAVDLVQTTFMETLRNDGVQTTNEFRNRMSRLEVNAALQERGHALPQLDQMALVDADGKVINSSRPWPPSGTIVADRSYFWTLKEHPERTTFISDPLFNRTSYTPTIVVAHRVNGPDRQFLGISFGAVQTSYFETLYKKVVNNEATAITLTRSDGMVMARYPAPEQVVGKILGGAASRLAASGLDSDMALQISLIDGTERLIASHMLSRYPMLVSVSTTTDSLLIPWRKQAIYLIAAACLLEFAVVVISILMLRQFRQQRRVEAKIEHLAQHDALTGLGNRLLFHSRLQEALTRCRRGECFAVLYLDLDHFKAVNDTLGHPAGDALLREVTQRLKLKVRDIDTIARLGGDEFAILQSISRPSDSAALAKRVIDALSMPYEISGNRVIIGVSIGIAIMPDDGEQVDAIVKNADIALYRSKADGRGRYRFFEAAMNAAMQARRALDLDLRKALADGEFMVFYQPLIDIATRSVCGFEALLRWRHPERGMISPADFIPFAEEIGLIIPLGKWVLRQACADAATWADNLKVAVNLSPVQLGCPTLVEDVAAALADSGLASDRLELEITETAMLADTNTVLVTLHLLRDLGLRIALDDFGTGYSSLSHLQRFPFSKVKIDRSFVSKLGQASDSDTIVSAMIDLCGRLGMMTTGEGVETPAQLERLAVLKCTQAQGYLFSQARPASEVVEMLRPLHPVEMEQIND